MLLLVDLVNEFDFETRRYVQSGGWVNDWLSSGGSEYFPKDEETRLMRRSVDRFMVRMIEPQWLAISGSYGETNTLIKHCNLEKGKKAFRKGSKEWELA